MGFMKYVVLDNFLENDLIIYLEKYFLEIPHYYGHTSIKDGIPFYSSELDMYNPLINFLCFKVNNFINDKISFLRVYINVQFKNMNGDFHTDDGDITALLMVSKTLKKNSGEFQIKLNNSENNIDKIDFIQNRIIKFNSNLEHRGLAPIEELVPRITLAFKTKKI
jgi:hypothetical protein